jgi:membrane-bound metal-dependent hydrolase YbcI (DUF457 family)
MPSPVAHSIAGLAIAHFALRRRQRPSGEQRSRQSGDSSLQQVFWFVALVFAANAADLDFLPGFLIGDPNRFHHRATHTLLAVLLFGLGTTAVARLAGFGPWRRFGVSMGLSYFTHIALDLVTLGTKEPYGMEIFQPFSSEPLMAPIHLFLDIRREGDLTTFVPSLAQWHNAEAIVRELLIMGGLWAVYWVISSLPERKTPQ